jgi:hypothetical protein
VSGLVEIAYNDAFDEGFYDVFDTPYTNGVYFISTGNLNNDGMADIVVSDDGGDRYLLNLGESAGVGQFLQFVFTYAHVGGGGPASDDGFAGNSVIADLDNDGWNDVLVTDVEVDIPGCGRRMHIYQNSGGEVGGSIALQETTTGSGCQTFLSNPPSCVLDDGEYAIYQGVLGDFQSRTPLTCATAGHHTDVVHWPSEADEYYLIVPQRDALEGSAGVDSAGNPRPPGPAPCAQRFLASCE